jgi:hypothetical protein
MRAPFLASKARAASAALTNSTYPKLTLSVRPLLESEWNPPFGAATFPIGNDTSASKLSKLLKLTGEHILIDTPAKITYKQILRSVICHSCGLVLCLLGPGRQVIFGLALLGHSFLLAIRLVIRLIRVSRGRVVRTLKVFLRRVLWLN